MGLVENMMVEGIGLDGKGCTNLKGNLRAKLGQGNLGTDPRREQLPKQRAFSTMRLICYK